MELNWIAIILATIVQFALGAIWYTFIFAKKWGEIHGFDKLPKETQNELASQMGPFYGGQLIFTILNTTVLAFVINALPNYSPYFLALLIWIGFILPTQYSDVIFGGTEGKWIPTKLAILSFASLLCILAAAFVLSLF